MWKRRGDSLAYSTVQTVIGEGTTISGNIQSCGTIRVDGTLEGTIEHDGELIVGPKGVLKATVCAKGMAIAGEVHGDVVVEGKLELLSTARLYGRIRYGHLVVQEGAYFEGTSNIDSTAPALSHGVA